MWILAIIAGVIVLWLIWTYNRFITKRNRADEAWSDIDVQLKRRYDLIPNLIATVKGYATHERELFEKVTQARANAIAVHDNPKTGPNEMQKSENMLTSALRSVFAVAENYPDLKANENFAKLQSDLTDTEDKIQAARRFYNSNVRALNILTEQFPSNLVAQMFNFKKREFFEVDNTDERKNVEVNF